MKDSKLLLTPELRAKVEAQVKHYLEIAEVNYERKFEMPEIRYNIKSWTAGLANHGKWLIRFNLILLVENEKRFLETTVPHEVAHLVNRTVNTVPAGKKRLMPHGKQWQAVMDVFSVPARVTHSYDCSSIEKISRHRTRGGNIDRVTRLIADMDRRLRRFSDGEKATVIDYLYRNLQQHTYL